MNKITPEIAERVRRMRNHPTASEKLMQAKLRHAGIAAIYQFPVVFTDSYFVADFYLPRYGVILEIDGDCHLSEEQRRKDQQKDSAYRTNGYHIVRIRNQDVDTYPTKTLTAYNKIKPPKDHVSAQVTQRKRRIRKEHKAAKGRNNWR